MDDVQKLPPPIAGRDVLRILRRRGLVALVTFLVVVAATLALTARMKPVYEATARVRVQNPLPTGGSGSLLDLLKVGGGSGLDAQVEVIRSRGILSEVIRKAKLETTPEELLRRVKLSPGANQEVLTIVVRARSAEEAARTANTLSNVFIESTRQEGEKASNRAIYGLNRALRVAEEKKDAAVQAMNAFNKRIGIADPSALFTRRALQTVETRQVLDQARSELQVERRKRDHHAANVQKIAPTVETSFTQTKNQAIDNYQFQLYELNRQRQEKLLDFTEESEEIQEIDTKIQAVRDGLKRAYENVYSKGSIGVNRNPDYSAAVTGVIESDVKITDLEAGIRANEALLARLKTEQQALAETKSRYEQLMLDQTDALATYQQLKQGIIKVNVSQLSSVPTIAVLDRAQVPGEPVSPKPLLNALMALFLGLFLAVAAALLTEYLASTAWEEEGLGLPQVAGVPLLGYVPVALPAPDAGELPVPVHGSGRAEDARAEDALREVGYNLVHLRHGKGSAPVVLLVGTRTDDTGAAIAAQLAAILVRDGLRVTLVDADRAHPRLNRVFGAPDAPGVADVLAGRVRVKDILHVGADGNLRFLAAGSPEDTTPLSERGLRSLFKDLTGDTDLVLVKGPSVFSVPAVAPLQKAADGLVLVTPPDARADESVARARRLLTNGHQPHIVGVVVSEAPDLPAKEAAS